MGMTVGRLKEIIAGLPDDADVIMQKRFDEKRVIVASVLSHRTTFIVGKGATHERLVLMNNEPVKNLRREG